MVKKSWNFWKSMEFWLEMGGIMDQCVCRGHGQHKNAAQLCGHAHIVPTIVQIVKLHRSPCLIVFMFNWGSSYGFYYSTDCHQNLHAISSLAGLVTWSSGFLELAYVITRGSPESSIKRWFYPPPSPVPLSTSFIALHWGSGPAKQKPKHNPWASAKKMAPDSFCNKTTREASI